MKKAQIKHHYHTRCNKLISGLQQRVILLTIQRNLMAETIESIVEQALCKFKSQANGEEIRQAELDCSLFLSHLRRLTE